MKLEKPEPAWIPPADLDPECLDICVAMNKVHGIRTTDSCCGHGKREFQIFFKADSLEVLPPLLYYVDSCHSGVRDFRTEVCTDCAMSPVSFVLVGPSGEEGYAGAKTIAAALEEYAAEEVQT